MNSNNHVKLAVVAAVLVGLFAVVAVNKYVESKTTVTPKPMANVLIASMEVRQGSEIGAEMLATTTIPLESLSNTHIALPASDDPTYEKAMADIQSKLIGRKAKRHIASRTPIFWLDVDTEPKAPFSDLIGSGCRAVTFAVDTVSSVNGFIRPGSRVDVVLTATESDLGIVTGTPTAGDGQRVVSSVILQNVPVIAVGKAYELDDADHSYGSITLNLPTRSAIMMIQARSMGQITYMLRNVRDAATERDRKVLTVSPGANFADAVHGL